TNPSWRWPGRGRPSPSPTSATWSPKGSSRSFRLRGSSASSAASSPGPAVSSAPPSFSGTASPSPSNPGGSMYHRPSKGELSLVTIWGEGGARGLGGCSGPLCRLRLGLDVRGGHLAGLFAHQLRHRVARGGGHRRDRLGDRGDPGPAGLALQPGDRRVSGFGHRHLGLPVPGPCPERYRPGRRPGRVRHRHHRPLRARQPALGARPMARQPAKVARSLQTNLEELGRRLGVETNFDVVVREIEIGGRKAALVLVDGLCKDTLPGVLQRLQELPPRGPAPDPLRAIMHRGLNYFEVETTDLLDQVVDSVLAGPAALLIGGVTTAVIIDSRTYPARSVDEPALERVTRGPKDGFTETLVVNTALIRRRVRDPQLRFEVLRAGTRSQTDIVVGYLADAASPALVAEIKRRVQAIETDSVVSGARTVEEAILGRSLNPLPRARYTERPDVAAALLWEGHVLLLIDTSPVALILPANLWHFTQHAEEYFQSP